LRAISASSTSQWAKAFVDSQTNSLRFSLADTLVDIVACNSSDNTIKVCGDVWFTPECLSKVSFLETSLPLCQFRGSQKVLLENFFLEKKVHLDSKLESAASSSSLSSLACNDLFQGLHYFKLSQSVDPRWSQLNLSGFSYGDGGVNMRVSTCAGSGSVAPLSGFLNKYSTSAIEEDKAEVFAAMLRLPSALFNSPDECLRKKATLLRERLSACCPEMDAAFWNRVQKVRIDYQNSNLVNIFHNPGPLQEQAQWKQLQVADGTIFWYNPKTQQTSWLSPELLGSQGNDWKMLDSNHRGVD
jgi:hypothetical protein